MEGKNRPGGLLLYKRPVGVCCWMGSHFDDYTDLARAKSEALDNIYSFFKQNIKSYNAKRRRQTPEKGEKQQ